jgi:hypothetical protein
VRERVVGSRDVNNYVLGVNFKGKPTHHLVTREAADCPYAINGKDTGCTAIGDVRLHAAVCCKKVFTLLDIVGR